MKEKQIHRLFQYSVFLKGLHAVLEIIGGIFFYFISTSAITQFVAYITADTLFEDPHDLVANFFVQSAQQLSLGGKTFAVLYLLSHGVIKLFLVIGLLREKLWAYPASLVVLGLFIAYQLYRYTFTHSLWLVVLTVFDLIVIFLIWHEYRLMQKHLPLE